MGNNVVMLGNPGAGKSTILNCLSEGQSKFPSGFQAKGLTSELGCQDVSVGGGQKVTFMDVPGLEDKQLRTQACEAIHQAMNRPGESFKIIFVISLEGGRVRDQDVATINCVLSSSQDITCKYGVIINKCKRKEIMRLKSEAGKMNDVLLQLAADPFNPDKIRALPQYYYLMPEIAELEGEDNVWTRLPDHDDVLNWVRSVPDCKITDEVKMIQPSEFEQMRTFMQEELKAVRADAQFAREQQRRAEEKAAQEVAEMREQQRQAEENAAQEVARMRWSFQSQFDRQQQEARDREELHRTQMQEQARAEEAERARLSSEMEAKMEQKGREQADERARAIAEMQKQMQEQARNAEQRLQAQMQEQRLQADKHLKQSLQAMQASCKAEEERRFAAEEAKRVELEALQLKTKGVPVSHVIKVAQAQGRRSMLRGCRIGGDKRSPWFDNDLSNVGSAIPGLSGYWHALPCSVLSGGALFIGQSEGDKAAAAFGATYGAGVDVAGLNVGVSTLTSGILAAVSAGSTEASRLEFRFGGQDISIRVCE